MPGLTRGLAALLVGLALSAFAMDLEAGDAGVEELGKDDEMQLGEVASVMDDSELAEGLFEAKAKEAAEARLAAEEKIYTGWRLVSEAAPPARDAEELFQSRRGDDILPTTVDVTSVENVDVDNVNYYLSEGGIGGVLGETNATNSTSTPNITCVHVPAAPYQPAGCVNSGGNCSFVAKVETAAACPGTDGAGNPCDLAPASDAVPATCGTTGSDENGQMCAVNAAGDACVSATGDCVFVAAVPAVLAYSQCKVTTGTCQFVPASTVPATCGNGTDADGNQCAVKEAKPAVEVGCSGSPGQNMSATCVLTEDKSACGPPNVTRTECDNVPSPWMVNQSLTCKDWPDMYSQKCKFGDADWLEKKYCAQNCWEHGAPYEYDDCGFKDTKAPTPTPTQTPTWAPTTVEEGLPPLSECWDDKKWAPDCIHVKEHCLRSVVMRARCRRTCGCGPKVEVFIPTEDSRPYKPPTPVPTPIPTAYMDGLTVVALNASSNSTCTFVAAAAAVVANTQCVSPTGLCSFQAASSVTVPAKCAGLDANNNTCQLAANGTSCSDASCQFVAPVVTAIPPTCGTGNDAQGNPCQIKQAGPATAASCTGGPECHLNHDSSACAGTGNDFTPCSFTAQVQPNSQCQVNTGNCSFVAANTTTIPATCGNGTDAAGNPCAVAPESPAVAATCGAGNDGDGNPCGVNAEGTGCVVNSGTCSFVAAQVAVAANSQCAVASGTCEFQAEVSTTQPATCGSGNDAAGNPCALAPAVAATCTGGDHCNINVAGTACKAHSGSCTYNGFVPALAANSQCAVKSGTCNFVAGTTTTTPATCGTGNDGAGNPCAVQTEAIPAVSATCGTGNDADGTVCVVNDAGTGCAVNSGSCSFVPAQAAVQANTQCQVATGSCTFQAATTVTTEATCGEGNDAAGNPCILNSAAEAVYATCAGGDQCSLTPDGSACAATNLTNSMNNANGTCSFTGIIQANSQCAADTGTCAFVAGTSTTVPATCGTGNDADGNACALNGDGTACAVATGSCQFVAASVSTTAATCGTGNDAAGNPCAVAPAKGAECTGNASGGCNLNGDGTACAAPGEEVVQMGEVMDEEDHSLLKIETAVREIAAEAKAEAAAAKLKPQDSTLYDSYY